MGFPDRWIGRQYPDPVTPQRLLMVVGIPLGLVIALLAPAWTAYDEFTHFARVVDMAQGNLEPTRST